MRIYLHKYSCNYAMLIYYLIYRTYDVPSASKVKKNARYFLKLRATLCFDAVLFQCCVQLFKSCMHFYKVACIFSKIACIFSKVACTFTKLRATFQKSIFKSCVYFEKVTCNFSKVTRYLILELIV